MPKYGSNRDKKMQRKKLPMKVNGKSVFLLMELATKMVKKKKHRKR